MNSPLTFFKGLFSRFFCSNSQATELQKEGKVDLNLLLRLKKETLLPISLCRHALSQFNSNYNSAKNWLILNSHEIGKIKVSKVENRPAREGRIHICITDRYAVMIEMSCESDFVSKNSLFINLTSSIATSLVDKLHEGQCNDLETIKTSPEISRAISEAVLKLGEKIVIKRAIKMDIEEGEMAGYYLHEGKLGAVVVYRQDGQREKRYRVRIGRHLASHVIGLKPRTVEELHSQPFLHDNKLTVKEFLDLEKIKVQDFMRISCGEELKITEDKKF
jgi:elongation factor Ts